MVPATSARGRRKEQREPIMSATTDAACQAPHVVMIVDNPITGDSRVQKQAMSMAERGWRVTLVGRRPKADSPKRKQFGEIPAQLVFVEKRVGHLPKLERSTLLRNPLAYGTHRKQRFADAMASHAIAEARMRIDSLKQSGSDVGLRRYRARAGMLRAKLYRRLVTARVGASNATRVKRRRASGRIDRLEPDLIHANDHRMALLELAGELGVADRVHTAPFVPVPAKARYSRPDRRSPSPQRCRQSWPIRSAIAGRTTRPGCWRAGPGMRPPDNLMPCTRVLMEEST